MNKKTGIVTVVIILISIFISIEIDIVKALYLNKDTDKIEGLIEITDVVEKETLKSIDTDQFDIFYASKNFFWSPDGSKLLVRTEVPIKTKNISTYDKKFVAGCSSGPFGNPESVSTVFWINADGSGNIDIARAEESIRTAKNNTFAFIQSAWWGFDADKIVFQVRNYCDEKPYKFYISDRNGSILAEVKGLDSPFMQWSSDGNKVAILDSKEKSRILIIDVKNSAVKWISLGISATGSGIAWNPDGNRIAFTGDKNGDIYTINIVDSSVQHLTTTVAARELRWKPDGKKLVFAAEGGLYLIDADGSNLTLIEKGNFELGPWSPDGRKILTLFVKRNEKEPDKLYALDINNMTIKLIVSAPFINGFTWSPNGQSLAFRSDSSSSIYAINSIGTDKVTLPESYSTTMEGIYSWGMDNRIYYLTNDSLVKINPDGTGRLLLVNNLSTDVYSPNKIYLSPDGSRILFTVFNLNDKREHVYMLKMKGYDEIMSIYTPISIKKGDDAFIEVKSMSKPVENATIFLNGREIGKTNGIGFLKYSFKEAGNLRLSAVKQGFRTANMSITAEERLLETTVIATATPVHTATDNTPRTSGFSFIFAVIALILTIYQIKKIRRIK